ncbi:MAG: efflux RND transporter periplasmic adaptor subunit [Gammaproteobacteria bacterium]|nr:efflux RND transporter periplasmic adaptor subunit [Gammaproteobacteria bacterium]
MILFLTLIYVAFLAILIKFKIVPLNTFWKLSPILWMLLLFFVLFIPMQWGAPAGAVIMYKPVIEVVPNVSGEVTSVEAELREPMQQGDVIFRIDAEQYQAKVDELNARLALARVNLDRAIQLLEKKVGRQLEVDQFKAEVDSLEALLVQAEWDLEKTTVVAPANGYIIGLTLRPGQRVSNQTTRSWVAFVDRDSSALIVGIDQVYLRHVAPGQKAEVVMKMLPGTTLNATVKGIAYMTPDGQLSPSGNIPTAPTSATTPKPYGVELVLDDKLPDILAKTGLPGGSVGTAAIYTNSVEATHVIRKVMLRMEAWMNYLVAY